MKTESKDHPRLKPMFEKLEDFLETPWATFLLGCALLVTSLTEIVQSFAEFTLGAHHGVALLGLMQILRALPEVVHGVHGVARAPRSRSRGTTP